jgi:chemotaxis protein methyltransferase WspC
MTLPDEILALLRHRIGLDPDSLGRQALSAAVAARLRASGVADLNTYADVLGKSDEEFAALVEEVVVSETWFSRGGDLFVGLAGHVRETAALGQPCRILSAACSTGEEPYSLAIALAEAGVSPASWELLALDLSSRNLRRAGQGLFGDSAFRQFEPSLRCRYFQVREGGWELDAKLRARVRFLQANLLNPALPDKIGVFSIVLCRNLLIYLHQEARNQVLASLERLLAPGGLVATGHAECQGLLQRGFEMVGPPQHCLFRRSRAPVLTVSKERPACQVALENRFVMRPAPQSSCSAPPPDLLPPSPSRDPMESLRQMADAGLLDEVLVACKAQLAMAASTELYNLMGIVHQARNEDDEAAACFRKTLYLDPDNIEALTHLVFVHQRKGDLAAVQRLGSRLRRTRTGGGP